LWGRKGRSLLLVSAVAIAAALTTAIGAASETFLRSLTALSGRMVGLAELRIERHEGGRLNETLLETVRHWKEVKEAGGRFQYGFTVRRVGSSGDLQKVSVTAEGVDPAVDAALNPRRYMAGRAVSGNGEIALDEVTAEQLGVEVGAGLEVIHWGEPVALTVVGVFERPKLEVMQKHTAIVSLTQAQTLAQRLGQLDAIDIKLVEHADSNATAARHAHELPRGARFQQTATIAAGVARGIAAARLMVLLVGGLVFLASGFIVLTSMTSAVLRQTRELAVLRAIGASRGTIAGSQLLAAMLVATLGAGLGAAAGLGVGYGYYAHFREFLPGGFQVSVFALMLAVVGALVAAAAGAAYPAMLASRAEPGAGLRLRSRRPRTLGLIACGLIAIACITVQPILSACDLPAEWAFWSYLFVGLPAMFIGFFLLTVPLLVMLAMVIGPLIARVLGVPAALIVPSLRATPYHHGLTAGTLLIGLAMLLTIWTDGRSIVQGWFDRIRMPDGFVHSYGELSPSQWKALESVEGIETMCRTTMFHVSPAGARIGVVGMFRGGTWFVASDLDRFIDMTDLKWIEGDRESAIERLRRGRAVLVSREYQRMHGVHLGDAIELPTPLIGPVTFDIAGVVSSPGLDIAVNVFGIAERYHEASLQSVFGTRQDAELYFGITETHLVLMRFKPGIDPRAVLRDIRRSVPGVRAGVSVEIREMVHRAVSQAMRLASGLAFVTLVIACIGVGNVIVTMMRLRRYEFGVLRSIGASPGLLGRLILGEVLIMALAGCLAGTLLGVQMSWMNATMRATLLGVEYRPHLALDITALGWAAVIGAAVIASAWPMWKVTRLTPRQLLGEG